MTKAPAKAKTKLRDARVDPPTDLGANAVGDISAALNLLLADAFALYMKTKNFHWHVSGPHFRDFHLMFDEQADQIFGITDEIAERVRKVGGKTIHSIAEIARTTRARERRRIMSSLPTWSPSFATTTRISFPGSAPPMRSARDTMTAPRPA